MIKQPEVTTKADIIEKVAQSDWYGPVDALSDFMITVHSATGLPWWATIIAATVTFRTLMLPLVLLGMKNTAKLSKAQPELEAAMKKFKASKTSDPDSMVKYQYEVAEILNSVDWPCGLG